MLESFVRFKDNKDRESIGKIAGVFGILCNCILACIKLVTGFVLGSVSVIADGFNNFFDGLSSVITVISFKFAGKPADKDHPYGHERIEYVSTLLLAFLILFVGYELVKTSLGRIFNPVGSDFNLIAVVLLVVSVLAKFFMSKVYLTFAKMIDSSMLKAAAKDALNDVFSTGAILACMVISYYTGVQLDGYAGLAVSVLIICSGISLIKESLDPILGSAPDKELVCKIEEKIMKYEGVIGIHDLIVHSYGPRKTFASVHAEVDADGDILESHDMIDNIEREVSKELEIELVIHMDPIVINDERVVSARDTVGEIVKSIDSTLSIHDFRMVPGNTHTNLIFDVVIPFEFCYTTKELFRKIEGEVKSRMGEEYFCVINFDSNYTL